MKHPFESDFHYEEKPGPSLRDSPASGSWVLGLKVCAIMDRMLCIFNFLNPSHILFKFLFLYKDIIFWNLRLSTSNAYFLLNWKG